MAKFKPRTAQHNAAHTNMTVWRATSGDSAARVAKITPGVANSTAWADNLALGGYLSTTFAHFKPFGPDMSAHSFKPPNENQCGKTETEQHQHMTVWRRWLVPVAAPRPNSPSNSQPVRSRCQPHLDEEVHDQGWTSRENGYHRTMRNGRELLCQERADRRRLQTLDIGAPAQHSLCSRREEHHHTAWHFALSVQGAMQCGTSSRSADPLWTTAFVSAQ